MSLVELCLLQADTPCRDLTHISPCGTTVGDVSQGGFPPVLQEALSLAHRCGAQLGGVVGVSCAG